MRLPPGIHRIPVSSQVSGMLLRASAAASDEDLFTPVRWTFRLRDLTGLAPAHYERRDRGLDEVRAVILHQTGFEWSESNPMWAQVRAHFVVHHSGLVSQLHPITTALRYGSGHANPWCISVEHEGNFPLAYRDGEPIYWRPEHYGRSKLSTPQIEGARSLLAWLSGQVRGLMVGAHRQVEARKSGCCGPDIWREVGRHAVDECGIAEMPTDGGADIPPAWRGFAEEAPCSP